MFKGIRQWLIDTYNGLYVIVLKPHMPSYAVVGAVVLAVLFGIFWSYVVVPVTFYDAAPHHMSQSNRDEWLKAVAGSYFAGLYNDQDTQQLLSRVEDPAANIERLIPETSGAVQAALQQTLPIAQGVSGIQSPRPSNPLFDILMIVLAVVIAVILTLIFSPIWRLLIKPNIFDNLYETLRPKSAAEVEEKKRQQADRMLIREKKEEEQRLRQESAAAAATNPYGAPIMQKLVHLMTRLRLKTRMICF
jgi:ABC-type multidrug transport system fused ATPase/permease subunit